jgi:hypothetical protein
VAGLRLAIGGCAGAASPAVRPQPVPSAPPPAPKLGWHAATKSISCPDGTVLLIPDDLVTRVRQDGAHEVSVVPGGTQASALVVTGSPGENFFTVIGTAYVRATGRVLLLNRDDFKALERASGETRIQRLPSETSQDGRSWKLGYAQSRECQFGALDLEEAGAPSRMTELVESIRIEELAPCEI